MRQARRGWTARASLFPPFVRRTKFRRHRWHLCHRRAAASGGPISNWLTDEDFIGTWRHATNLWPYGDYWSPVEDLDAEVRREGV